MHDDSDGDDTDDELLSLSVLRALSSAGVEIVSPAKRANRLHLESHGLLSAAEARSDDVTRPRSQPTSSSASSEEVSAMSEARKTSKQLMSYRSRDNQGHGLTVLDTDHQRADSISSSSPRSPPRKTQIQASGAKLHSDGSRTNDERTQEGQHSDVICASADDHAALAALLFP